MLRRRRCCRCGLGGTGKVGPGPVRQAGGWERVLPVAKYTLLFVARRVVVLAAFLASLLACQLQNFKVESYHAPLRGVFWKNEGQLTWRNQGSLNADARQPRLRRSSSVGQWLHALCRAKCTPGCSHQVSFKRYGRRSSYGGGTDLNFQCNEVEVFSCLIAPNSGPYHTPRLRLTLLRLFYRKDAER